MQPTTDIFTRLRNGETVPFNDPEYHKLRDVSFATRKLLLRLNQSADPEEMRDLLSQITGTEIDASTAIFPPFYVNYGRHTMIGKNVFINLDCVFLDFGGITIEDGVFIAPKVSLLTEGPSIRTVPLNQSFDPFVDGCEPTRVISIPDSFRFDVALPWARKIVGSPTIAAPTILRKLRRSMGMNPYKVLRTLAGIPPTTLSLGTSLVTTAPAATTAFSPIVTPCITVAFAPIHACALSTEGTGARSSHKRDI
jgi:hypothetical protein